METQTYRFKWRGIGIEAVYTPLKWDTIAYLEIRSISPESAPLPVSQSGYRSHFQQPGTLEAHGADVVTQVIVWLNEEAASPEWIDHEEKARQFSLF